MGLKELFILFLIMFSNVVSGQFDSKLIQLDSTRYQLIVKTCCINNDSNIITKRLPYKVFKFRQADIDNDSIDEIILGVYKSTIFDTLKRNRINIWKVDSNMIVPKWLGSFLPRPLYDFDILKDNGNIFIQTIEYEQNDLYLVSVYKWHSFGIKYIRTTAKNLNLNDALKLLNNSNEKN